MNPDFLIYIYGLIVCYLGGAYLIYFSVYRLANLWLEFGRYFKIARNNKAAFKEYWDNRDEFLSWKESYKNEN